MASRAATGLLVTFLLLVAACGAPPAGDLPGAAATEPGAASTALTLAPGASQVRPQLPATVRSADGRTVTVTDVSRVVPLQGHIAEVVFDLGLGDHVVARDISTTFEEARHLPLVTRAHDVSAESVLSVRPTLVLVDSETGPPEAIDHIRNVGVPVVELTRPTSTHDIVPRIHEVAAALGVPAAGEALAADTEAALADAAAGVPDDIERPTVAFLYLRGGAGVYLLGGPRSGADSMIEAAGGIDAGTALGLDDPFTPITSEALVQAAPDALLLTTTGLESVGGLDGLLDIAGVAQTPAGRDRRVVTLEDGLLFGFGARTPDAIRHLVAQLHPAAR